MSLNNPSMHEGFVPAYQVSAVPFVTSSTVTTVNQVSFPFVTRFFTIQNNSSLTLRFGFTEAGVKGTNYFSVPSGSSYTGEIRTDTLFLSSSTAASISYSVIAGLTGIPTRNFLTITGSNGFVGVG
jgi:hypothetical protein